MTWLLGLAPGLMVEHVAVLVASFAVALLATAVVRRVCPRIDFVSRPKGERWSKKAVPMGGGVAMFVAMAPALYLLSPDLFVAAAAVHVLGLVDDRKGLSPAVKLVVQTVAACWVVAGPLRIVLAGAAPLDALGDALVVPDPLWLAVPLSIAWHVGVSNSVNLLDNMDGSAAGVSAVAAGFLYVLATGGPAPDAALAATAAAVLGAALGFLVHNFPPARVFMGDAGSLVLGFVLASLAARLPRAASDPAWRDLAVAAIVLGTPIFDTALVWFARRAAHRPFLQGGRDHAAHRLARLGLSERRTVLVLYGVTAALGGLALGVARGGLGVAVTTAIGGGVVLVLLGVFLGEVSVYAQPAPAPAPGPDDPAAPAGGAARRRGVLYAAEVAVDVATLSAAWIAAWTIRFDAAEGLGFYLHKTALPALPIVVAVKVTALLAFNLYRGLWRTIHFADVAAVGRAVTLGSLVVVVLATLTQRFEDYSRAVIVIDWLLSLLAVLGSRSALRFLRDAFGRLVERPRRALLLGPEALRPLLALAGQPLEVVAVAAPDVAPDALLEAARAAQADVVVVAVPLADGDARLAAVRGAGLDVRRAALVLE